ncbi:MAG: sulfatase-like hydrolase/transferase [Bacteroidetes bacterium]|nr:sulfatase-like hydrolase/transferase [Bacteroidota bacterium]
MMKKYFSLLFIFLFYTLCVFSQTASKPNIILIIVDDLNDYVEGFNGQTQITTPNINFLIENGYQFNNAFCNNPVCAASRTSFLSGKDILYTNIYANNAYIDEFRDNFTETSNNEEVITLPEHLKDVGNYYTIGVNKVFHDPFNKDYDATTADPCEKALSWSRVISFGEFDETDSILLSTNEGVEKFKWGRVPDIYEPDMKDSRAVDSTIKVLTEINTGEIELCDSSFFLALGFALPHLDLFVPQSYFSEFYLEDIYAADFKIPYNFPVNSYPPNGIIMPPQPEIKWNDYFNLGPLGKSIAIGQGDIEESFTNYTDSLPYLPVIDPDFTDSLRWEVTAESKRANAVMAYMAGVKSVDSHIGRILAYLETVPEMKENTIIVLVSDNGFSLGEKHHWMKRSLWDMDIRIPFVIYDPNRPGNIISDRTVSLLDLYPTICELTNTPYPEFSDGSNYLDGKSIVPLLDNPELAWERPVLISWEAEANKECSCFPQFAIRSDKFKYIEYSSDGDDPLNSCNPDSSFKESEFYEIGVNRETDPNEWNNLIDNPDYEPVINYLTQWMPDGPFYLKNTYKILIKNNALPCLVNITDTLNLYFDLYDTLGIITTPPINYVYQWTNNLTDDIFYTPTTQFPLNEIPEAVFSTNDRIMFYIEMIDTIENTVVAFDTKYFYLESDNIPNVSFGVVNGTELTAYITDLEITGSYNSIWWDFGEGNLIYSADPGPYTYLTPGTYTVLCYMQYGNDPGCIISFEQTIKVEVSDYTSNNTLFIYPNPANEYVNIFINESVLNGMFYVTDVVGRITQVLNLTTNDYPFIQINISNYTPGVYFVINKKPGEIETGSFIVMPKN